MSLAIAKAQWGSDDLFLYKMGQVENAEVQKQNSIKMEVRKLKYRNEMRSHLSVFSAFAHDCVCQDLVAKR